MSSSRKVYFYTLGCRVNQYETDATRELFTSAGYEETDDPSKAQVCVVNTCTVTAEADRKSGQRLRRLSRENPDAVIVAMGCASQMADGVVDADIVISNKDRNNIIRAIEEFKGAKTHKTQHVRPEVTRKDDYHDFGTVVSPEGSRAFMKIEDGCDNFCSYCIIPFARGRVASRSRESILNEARSLAASGFREIIVSGIVVCSYGKDRGEGIESLLGVLNDIASVEGISRIRIGSMEPSSLTSKFIEGNASIDKLCPHFHLSLQSGSDTVLKRMNRKYDSSLYLEKVRLLREAFPTMKLTTDIICGFPGETDEEFEETLEFVKEAGLSKIHVFPYSVREGTRAASMPQVPGNVAKQRVNILLDHSSLAEASYAKSLVGKDLEVLIETEREDYYTGYCREYVMTHVYVKDGIKHKPGDIITVKAVSNDGAILIC